MFYCMSHRIPASLPGLLLLAGSVLAAPSVTTLYPRGAGLGEDIEIQFLGRGLADAEDVLFYDPGIELVEFKQVEARAPYLREDGRDARHNPDQRQVAVLRVADDAKLGEHRLRLVGRTGASQIKTFWVGAFPSFVENEHYKEPNDEPANATGIPPLPITVNGALARGDTDSFRFAGRKGQRIAAELEGIRLGSHERGGIVDFAIELRDADGKVVAANEDSALFLADPVLETTLPADGDYTITVAPQITGYMESLTGYYRLHLGDFRRALPYPAGGPEAPALDGRPTPGTFRVSELPNVLETEPNDKPEATELVVSEFPAALNGRIETADDTDHFLLKLGPEHAGQWKMVLHGQSVGSSIDADIEWQERDARKGTFRVRGKGADSRPEQRGFVRLDSRVRDLLDPTVLVTVPEAGGEFAVKVTDTYGRGGADYVYRVEFEPVVDGLAVHIPPYGNNSSQQIRNRVHLPVGNASPTWFSTKPYFGSSFQGDCHLVAKGLPEGVVMEAPILEEGQDRVPVVFIADKRAEPGAYLIEVLAEPTAKGTELESRFQQVVNFHSRQNGNCMVHSFVDKLALIVTEPAPFSLSVEQPSAALLQDGEFEIPFKIHREPGFDDQVEVTMEWLPPNVNRATPVRIKAGESEGFFTMSANRRAEPRGHQVLLTAMAGDPRYFRYGGGDYVLASRMFEVQIGEPYVTARIGKASVEQGKEGVVEVKLEHLRKLPGKARATLRGLPRGVELVDEHLAFEAGTEQLAFRIKADRKALFGMNRGVQCVFEFNVKGETIQQKSGYGYLRIDPARNVSKVSE